MKYVPNEDQKFAIKWALSHPNCGLFLPPGFGKTAVILKTFKFLKENMSIDKMIVISTIRISQVVWKLECKKWDDFQDLKVLTLHGTDKDIKVKQKADVYTLNVEGLIWFEQHLAKFCNNSKVLVVFDESTLFKNHTSKRFKIIKKYLNFFSRRIIMSGTPTPNGLLQLWPQMYICDGGKRLSKFVTHYRSRFFTPSYNGFSWMLARGAETEIYKLVDDVLMHRSLNDLDLPEISYNNIHVELDSKSMKMYQDMRKEGYADENDTEIVALSAGSKANKLKQIANGNVYYDDKKNHLCVHTKKLEAIMDLVEELDGSPLLIVYEYKHDLALLKSTFQCPVIGGGVSQIELENILLDWEMDKLPVLLLHPMSGGHGLNLQTGGCHNICWYSLTFDLELYLQTNKRIHRQGVKNNVKVHHIIADGTIDSHILNVLTGKESLQNALLAALTK